MTWREWATTYKNNARQRRLRPAQVRSFERSLRAVGALDSQGAQVRGGASAGESSLELAVRHGQITLLTREPADSPSLLDRALLRLLGCVCRLLGSHKAAVRRDSHTATRDDRGV